MTPILCICFGLSTTMALWVIASEHHFYLALNNWLWIAMSIHYFCSLSSIVADRLGYNYPGVIDTILFATTQTLAYTCTGFFWFFICPDMTNFSNSERLITFIKNYPSVFISLADLYYCSHKLKLQSVIFPLILVATYSLTIFVFLRNTIVVGQGYPLVTTDPTYEPLFISIYLMFLAVLGFFITFLLKNLKDINSLRLSRPSTFIDTDTRTGISTTSSRTLVDDKI